MLILCIDSASSSCGVCVWQDGRVLALLREKMERGQDARLMPMVVEAMQQAGVDFAQLDQIAVTRGPGSFTGLRVGIAAARGIGIASDKSVVGINRFTAYRRLHKDLPDALVVLESKRTELFCQMPDGDIRLLPQNEIDALEMKSIGDIATPDAEILLVCAELAAEGKNETATPLYLREADVTLPRSAQK
jgi:tRNA threonylcarbamoyladenosine biosynthesis protein TsaB